MRHVEDLLVVRISVDGGHKSAVDDIFIMDYLGGRSQAVRRAGGVGNHMVGLRIILVFVDTHHDGQVFTFSRCGNDDFPGTSGSNVVDRALDGLALFVDAVFLDCEKTGGFQLQCLYPVLSRIAAGSVSLKPATFFPSTRRPSSATSTVPLKRP